jgi:hypothetical protein
MYFLVCLVDSGIFVLLPIWLTSLRKKGNLLKLLSSLLVSSPFLSLHSSPFLTIPHFTLLSLLSFPYSPFLTIPFFPLLSYFSFLSSPFSTFPFFRLLSFFSFPLLSFLSVLHLSFPYEIIIMIYCPTNNSKSLHYTIVGGLGFTVVDVGLSVSSAGMVLLLAVDMFRSRLAYFLKNSPIRGMRSVLVFFCQSSNSLIFAFFFTLEL